MREWGLPEGELVDLKNSLQLDGGDASGQDMVVGERTQSWIGRIATGVAAGSIKLAENIGVQTIVALLTKAVGR